MLRFVEIILFLSPLLLYMAWWVLGARAARWLPWVVTAAVAVLAGMVLVYRFETAEPAKSVYVPAQIHGGTVVPGHAR